MTLKKYINKSAEGLNDPRREPMTTAPDGVNTGGGYGSHQPALRALARFMPIRSVIEFGAGVFSTHLFLDPEAFPDLTSLVTFENTDQYIDDVKVDDGRHRIIISPPEELMDASDGMKADFVFLDNAPIHVRIALVEYALALAPIFGIHDCSVETLKTYPGGDCKYLAGFNTKIQTVFASNTVDLSGLTL